VKIDWWIKKWNIENIKMKIYIMNNIRKWKIIYWNKKINKIIEIIMKNDDKNDK